jgi:hypothetical protein
VRQAWHLNAVNQNVIPDYLSAHLVKDDRDIFNL